VPRQFRLPPQPAGGADQLTLNADGLYASDQGGQIVIDGHPAIHYTGIELINILNHAYKLFLSLISR
jgi:hypothetical protein